MNSSKLPSEEDLGEEEEEICEFMEEVEGECRPFNFDRDVGKKRVWKLDPRELFEAKGGGAG